MKARKPHLVAPVDAPNKWYSVAFAYTSFGGIDYALVCQYSCEEIRGDKVRGSRVRYLVYAFDDDEIVDTPVSVFYVPGIEKRIKSLGVVFRNAKSMTYKLAVGVASGKWDVYNLRDGAIPAKDLLGNDYIGDRTVYFANRKEYWRAAKNAASEAQGQD